MEVHSADYDWQIVKARMRISSSIHSIVIALIAFLTTNCLGCSIIQESSLPGENQVSAYSAEVLFSGRDLTVFAERHPYVSPCVDTHRYGAVGGVVLSMCDHCSASHGFGSIPGDPVVLRSDTVRANRSGGFFFEQVSPGSAQIAFDVAFVGNATFDVNVRSGEVLYLVVRMNDSDQHTCGLGVCQSGEPW